MSAFVTSILSWTVGLLCDKVSDTAAHKLKDGDITDVKIRELIVRELSDVKAKLDGLSRKELVSSYSFLKEGVDLLNASLDQSKANLNPLLNDDSRGETSRKSSIWSVESDTFNEALSDTMEMLKTNSEGFESAKKRFKHARIRATDAFCNESLSIKDRIFAAKLRVVSEILECLDCPHTAIPTCLSFLEDLHGLPAIRETFSVYLKRGLKSRLNKAERLESVKSVMVINYVLFQFNSKFGRKLADRLSWPGCAIELPGRSFNPILNWQEISKRKSWGEELIEPRNELSIEEEINPCFSAVNNTGDVFVLKSGDEIKVISKKGESMVNLPQPITEGDVMEGSIKALAVDNNGDVYVVRCLQTRTKNSEEEKLVLYVMDENYNLKHECTLDFLNGVYNWVGMAINRNNDVIIVKICDPFVYICDSTGKLKRKFKRDSRGQVRTISISDKDEIMMKSRDDKGVHVYSDKGELKSTINVPEGHVVLGVVYHPVVCKMVILSSLVGKYSYFLLSYSDTGELESSNFLCKGNRQEAAGAFSPNLISHPSGAVAVVRKTSITFI